jgi:carbonic anhydrase
MSLTAAPAVAAAAVPQQSPVDVRVASVRRRRGLPQLGIHYSADTEVSVRYVRRDDADADGCSTRGVEETEEIDVLPGAGWIDFAGTRYDLAQFHFHTPSEHTVEGRHAPLEMHLVHQSAAGVRLVLAVLLVPGRASEPDKVLQQLSGECGDPVTVEHLNLGALLPANHSTVRYTGSLTTAPYTEGVLWFLTVPKTVSPTGIANFQTLFPDGDSRPAQPLNGRVLTADLRW